MRILILGAGYLGAAPAELALAAGDEVALADNWYATDRGQLAGLERARARGSRPPTSADASSVDALLRAAPGPRAAARRAGQPPARPSASPTTRRRPTSPARAASPRRSRARARPRSSSRSSLHVYGAGLAGEVGPEHPYGAQGDLAHLSKIYARAVPATCYARRHGFDARLSCGSGSSTGRARSSTRAPESQTVVDKFRRLAAGGRAADASTAAARATIGVVHVDDAARILLDAPARRVAAANVAAETVTVGDVAALAAGARAARRRRRAPSPRPFEYRARRRGVPARRSP